MSRIQQLAKIYGSTSRPPGKRTVADSQRVIMIVYDKELERDILAHKDEFEIATKQANHDWYESQHRAGICEWIAAAEYRDAYFDSPDDLQLSLSRKSRVRRGQDPRGSESPRRFRQLRRSSVWSRGLVRLHSVSQVLKLVEPSIRGRLVIFFPDSTSRTTNAARARDGWNTLQCRSLSIVQDSHIATERRPSS